MMEKFNFHKSYIIREEKKIKLYIVYNSLEKNYVYDLLEEKKIKLPI